MKEKVMEENSGYRIIFESIKASDNKARTFLNIENLANRYTGLEDLPKCDVYWSNFLEDRHPEFTIEVLELEHNQFSHTVHVPIINMSGGVFEDSRATYVIAKFLQEEAEDFEELKRLCIEEGVFTEKELEEEKLKKAVTL